MCLGGRQAPKGPQAQLSLASPHPVSPRRKPREVRLSEGHMGEQSQGGRVGRGELEPKHPGFFSFFNSHGVFHPNWKHKKYNGEKENNL